MDCQHTKYVKLAPYFEPQHVEKEITSPIHLLQPIKVFIIIIALQLCTLWNLSSTCLSFENKLKECASYVLENTTIVGCDHPYEDLIHKRFAKFTTKLKSVNRSFELTHNLQSKGMSLNP